MLEEQLPERAASMGAYLMQGLTDRLFRHGITGDIRGKGLLIGIELVQDRASKVQLENAHVQAVLDLCKADGVIVGRSGGGARHSNTVVLSPPLVITKTECDTLIEVLDRAIGRVVAMRAGQA
jgi:4-aminobutyrate aminotransferase-like enzyme